MKITRLALSLFGIVVLMQFNNCSPVGNTTPFNNGYLLGVCDPLGVTNPNADVNNVNCAVPDTNNIEINPGGGDTISVVANQADFNIAGSCNDGGYPVNVIYWTLNNSSGTAVRNSGMIFNNQAWNGQCVQGTFNLYIELVPITEDNNNRIGLLDPTTGTRTFYTITVSIVGFDSSGTAHPNTVFGVRTINLTPL